MNDLPGPRAISKEGARRRLPLALARLTSAALVMIGFVAGFALAQSQSAPSPSTEASAPQTSSPQQPPSPAAQAKPQSRRIVAPSVADVARKDQAAADAGSEKVYTNNDVDALPSGGISIVGPPPSPTSAKPKPQPVDDTAQKAAYWKARFTAARRKLAADKKALPMLQREFEIERVQENIGDPDTGQLYSDTHMELLREIAATKAAIARDQKALKDLREEFRESKGKADWIR
jgi:hypothetical protein